MRPTASNKKNPPRQGSQEEQIPSWVHLIGINAHRRKYSIRRNESQEAQREHVDRIMILPCVASIIERIRKVCRSFNLEIIFKSGPTLRSILTRVKDLLPLPVGKQAGVVYQIPWSGGMSTKIGETKRHLATQLKEHKHACTKASTKSLQSQSIPGMKITQSTGTAPGSYNVQPEPRN